MWHKVLVEGQSVRRVAMERGAQHSEAVPDGGGAGQSRARGTPKALMGKVGARREALCRCYQDHARP